MYINSILKKNLKYRASQHANHAYLLSALLHGAPITGLLGRDVSPSDAWWASGHLNTLRSRRAPAMSCNCVLVHISASLSYYNSIIYLSLFQMLTIVYGRLYYRDSPVFLLTCWPVS